MVEAHDCHHHLHSRGEKKLKEILKVHDANGDGRLSRNEPTEGFRQLGACFPAFRAVRALNRITNGDGFNSDCDQLVHCAANHGYAIYLINTRIYNHI